MTTRFHALPLPTILLGALLADIGTAQITGLCNTGQTAATASGCTGLLVPPNPFGGGPNRDGNWRLAYPYPSASPNACRLKAFERAWVDSPANGWLPNGDSAASEWI